MITIDIAKEFTRLPGPRYQAEGNGSGEEFRERHLKPAFRRAVETGEKLTVGLDGVEFGYPAGFLEEAFGGLAREFGKSLVLKTVGFVSATEPMLEYEIRTYIDRVRTP